MFKVKHENEILKKYVQVGSHGCSRQFLDAMARSEVDRIRLRVAENPRTSIAALEMLASDSNPDVRVAVGINPATPPRIALNLIFDHDVNVRLGLADDVKTPMWILNKLRNDSNPYVSCRAHETIKIIHSHGKPPKDVRRRVARWLNNVRVSPTLQYA
ncbi:MAG TPA: hypothetical protein V6C89_16265 [Drouetiella sp.]|jgi:hypothetical protein